MALNPKKLSSGQLNILKAVAVLLEDSSQKITIARIAKEIHVTDGAIYRHYRSKHDIFESIMGYMESNLMTPLDTLQGQSTDTKRRLEMVFSAYMQFLAGHPGLARLLLGSATAESPAIAGRVKILNEKLRAQIVQILKFGKAQGVMRSAISPEQATELFYGLVLASAMAQAYDMPQIAENSRWKAFVSAVFS